jgi:hypothetical protein
MTYQGVSDLLQRITSFYPKLSITMHSVIRTLLAIIFIGFIWASFSVAHAGRGGIEAEVGDVQGSDNGLYLYRGKQSPSSEQDEMEKSRLKALDEKLRKAEEEGNRPPAESSETGSGPPAPSNTGGAKP